MGLGAVSARSEKKLSTGSKVKREKVRWVALHPPHGSLRPAMPVASGVFGLSDVHFEGWVADKVVSKMGGL